MLNFNKLAGIAILTISLILFVILGLKYQSISTNTMVLGMGGAIYSLIYGLELSKQS